MRSRLLLFTRAGGLDSCRVLFGLANGSLTHEHPFPSLSDLATQLGLQRHESFDWAVGDAGARCALLELPPDASPPEPHTLGPLQHLQWLAFREAARALLEGEDRRYLQLAVQFISQGGVDDSVLASDYDESFLKTLRKELERQADPEEDRT